MSIERPRVYRYNLRAAATLLGGASTTTLSCPCKGAKYVILRYRSTDAADSLSAVGFNAGNDNANLMFSGSGGVVSPHVSLIGAPTGFRMDRTGGLIAVLIPVANNQNQRFPFDYIQATATAGGVSGTNDITGFQVDAEVFYDDGADQVFGQVLATQVGVGSSLAFAVQPSTVVAGAVIAPPVQVKVSDANGNQVVGVSVTMALTTGSGVLTGGGSVITDANGIATFPSLSVSLAGAGKVITASSGALTPVASGTFTVS